MSSATLPTVADVDVAVIGGGPSGLAAATALKEAGVKKVLVLDREPEAGGIPRHCGHPPFGLREFKRVLKGPEYAARLVAQALDAGVEIRPSNSVTAALPDGLLTVATPEGVGQIKARRVVYATGVRETPRSARLVSGARVQGVVNTGALQSLVYLQGRRPFKRPVIIGSELVSFSALMTCRHAGIRPVAMIEAGPSATARWPSAVFPRLLGVSLRTNTKLLKIEGTGKVERVLVTGPNGQEDSIECDGVILTGLFTPEAALARRGHLEVDASTGGLRVDQWGRCSDPAYFATGNVLRAVETAGKSWAEGRLSGQWVAQDLEGRLPEVSAPLSISIDDRRIKYAMPHLICPTDDPRDESGMSEIQLRLTERVSGTLIAKTSAGPIWQRSINSRPERRVAIPIAEIVAQAGGENITFGIKERHK